MGKFTSLEKCVLTKSWDLEDRAALAHFLEKQNLKKGEHLFFEKSLERKLYILDEGEIQLEAFGQSVILGPGSSLGELSLIRETEKRVTARASQNCQFWVITEIRWREIQSQMPELARKLSVSILKKFAQLMEGGVSPPSLNQLQKSHIAQKEA